MASELQRRREALRAQRKSATSNTDYSGFSGAELLNNRNFLNDVRSYYRDQGEMFSNNKEMLDNFYTDRRWRDVNSVSLLGGAAEYAMGGSDRERMARLSNAWRNAPSRGGFLDKAIDYGTGAILDPVNIIPTVSAGKVAQATRLAQLSKGTNATEAAAMGVREGTKRGAISEAKLNAAIEGGFDIGAQATEIQQGITDEYDPTRTAAATALGGTAGYGAGRLLGGVASRYTTGKDLTLEEQALVNPATPTGMADVTPDQLLLESEERLLLSDNTVDARAARKRANRGGENDSDAEVTPPPNRGLAGPSAAAGISGETGVRPWAAKSRELTDLDLEKRNLQAEREQILQEYRAIFEEGSAEGLSGAKRYELQRIKDDLESIDLELAAINKQVAVADAKFSEILKAEEELENLMADASDPEKASIASIEAKQQQIRNLNQELSGIKAPVEVSNVKPLVTDIEYDIPVATNGKKFRDAVEGLISQNLITRVNIKALVEDGTIPVSSRGNFTKRSVDALTDYVEKNPTATKSDEKPTPEATSEAPGPTTAAAVPDEDALAVEAITDLAFDPNVDKQFVDFIDQVNELVDPELLTDFTPDQLRFFKIRKAKAALDNGEISQEVHDLAVEEFNFDVADYSAEAVTGRPTDKQLKEIGGVRSKVEAPKQQKGVTSIKDARAIYTGDKADELFARYDKLQGEVDKLNADMTPNRVAYQKELKDAADKQVKSLRAQLKKTKNETEKKRLQKEIKKTQESVATGVTSFNTRATKEVYDRISEQQDILKEFTPARFNKPDRVKGEIITPDMQTKMADNLEQQVINWRKKQAEKEAFKDLPEIEDLTQDEVLEVMRETNRRVKRAGNAFTRDITLQGINLKDLSAAQRQKLLEQAQEKIQDTVTKEALAKRSRRLAGSMGRATDNVDVYAGKSAREVVTSSGERKIEVKTQAFLRKAKVNTRNMNLEAVKLEAEQDQRMYMRRASDEKGNFDPLSINASDTPPTFYEFKPQGNEVAADGPRLTRRDKVAYYAPRTTLVYRNVDSLVKLHLISEEDALDMVQGQVANAPVPQSQPKQPLSISDLEREKTRLKTNFLTKALADPDQFDELQNEYLKMVAELDAANQPVEAPKPDKTVVNIKGEQLFDDPVGTVAEDMPPTITDASGNQLNLAAIPKDPNFKFTVNGQQATYSARMISDNQIAEGRTIYDVIGSRTSPDDWDLAYLPANFSRRDMSNPYKVKKAMVAADKKEPTPVQQKTAELRDEPVKQAYTPPPMPMPQSQASNTGVSMASILQTEADGEEIVRSLFTLQSMEKNPRFKSLKEFSRANISIQELDSMVDRSENGDWDATVSFVTSSGEQTVNIPYERRVEHLRHAYKVLRGVAPKGVRQNTTTLNESIKQATGIFTKATPATRTEIARVLKVVLPSGVAPRFVEDNVNNSGFQSASPSKRSGQNTIRINTGAVEGTGVTPTHLVLHEVGHWVYKNMMTMDDRLAFWQELSKYYENGKINPKAFPVIGKPEYDADGNFMRNSDGIRLPNVGEAGIVSKTSPQEYFANQFVAYMMNHQDALVTPKNWTLWDKIQSYAKALWTKLTNPAYEDSNLTPLFERLITDKDNAAMVAHLNPVEPTNDFTKSIRVRYNDVKVTADEINAHMASGNVQEAALSLQKLATLYRSMAFNTRDAKIAAQKTPVRRSDGKVIKGVPFDDTYPGVFSPIKSYAIVMKRYAKNISDALRVEDTRTADNMVLGSLEEGAIENALNVWTGKKVALVEGSDVSPTDPTLESFNKNILSSLNMAYKNVTGGDIPEYMPAELRFRRNMPVGSSGRKAHSVSRMRAINNARQVKHVKVTKDIKAVSNEAMRKSADNALKANEPLPDFNKMDLDTLLANWHRFGQTRLRTQVAQHAVDLSHQEMPVEVTTAARIFKDGASYMELMDIAWKAKAEGNNDHVNLVIYELQKRKNKKTGQKYAPPEVNNAITKAQEAKEYFNQGEATSNGVPPKAPYSLRSWLEPLSHRKARTEYVLRTMSSMLAYMGADLPFNPRSPEYDDFRKMMRKEAATLEKSDDITSPVSTLSGYLFNDNVIDPTSVELLERLAAKFDIEPKDLVARIVVEDTDMQTKPTTVKNLMEQLSGEDRFHLEDAINDVRQNIIPAIGVITKGLIAQPAARKRFPLIPTQGEYIAPNVTVRKGSPTVHYTETVPAEHAGAYVDDVIDNMSNTQLAAARRFTQSDNPTVYYAAVSKLGGLSSGVKLRRVPSNTITNNKDKLLENYNDPMVREQVSDLLDEISLTSDEIARVQFTPDDSPSVKSHANFLFEYEKTLRDELKTRYGVDADIETTPVFVRDIKPATFDNKVTTNHPIFTELTSAILRDSEGQNSEGIGNIINELEGLDLPRGNNVYNALVAMAGSQQKLNRIMKQLEFTSYEVNGVKTLINSSDMRYIRDYAFAETDLNHTVGIDASASSANTTWVEAATLGDQGGENMRRSIFSALESVGVSPAFVDTMDKLRRGKKATEADAQNMRQAATFWTTRNNPEILANSGMTFLSKVFNPLKGGGGHYERHAVAVSKICTPLLKKLNALPDGGNLVSRWFKDGAVQMYEAAGDALGFVPSNRSSQPLSHNRIIGHLRRGDREGLVSDAEKEIYDEVRGYFDQTMQRMRREGMNVGKIESNYVPQVYRKDIIEADRPEFERRLALYFLKEDSVRPRGPKRKNPLTQAQAEFKAKAMADQLVADDGVQRMPDNNIRRTPSDNNNSDHAFQRMIRLDLFEEFIDQNNPNNLADYLENDIMVVVSKYSDAAERDMDLFKNFGAGHHAIDDYFIALNSNPSSVEALASLLKGKKVSSKLRFVRNPVDQDIVENKFDFTYMEAPPSLLAEGRAEYHARELVKMAQSGTMKHEMAEYMNRLYRRSQSELAELSPAERRMELMKQKNFKLRAEAIADGLHTADGGLSPVHRKNQLHARGFLNAVRRRPINDETAYSGMAETTQKWLTGFNAVTLLPFTTLTSMGDSMLPLVQSGNFQAWVRGIKNYAQDEDYREMVRNIGAATENITYKYMTQAFGVDSTKFTNGYFNATLLTPWTEMWRNLASAIGYEHLRMMQRQAINEPNTRKGRIAKRQMDAYGLQDFYKSNSIELESAMDNHSEEYFQVATALNRFTNEAIFTPNPSDNPVWGQTPIGKIVYQLKSFPMMMWRLHRRAWNRFLDNPRDADIAPLMYMYTAAPAMGFAAANIKDIVQGRGGQDNREFKFRERSLAEQFAWAENMDEDTAKYLGWYWDGFVVMGGMGLIGEMLYDIGSNVDNGAFGQVRIGEVILGPSMGLFNDGLTVGSGVSDIINDSLGGTSSNYKEREMVDTLFHRFAPPVGSMPALREDFVDAVAGEPSGRKKKSGSGISSRINSKIDY